MKESTEKIRLDLLLIRRLLAVNREEAQRWIRAGKVLVEEIVIDKPGTPISLDAVLRVVQPDNRYVGRGGLKLEAALNCFDLDVSNLTAADLGASTGGFTDCLLQHGVRKVFAVDVGYGQLNYRLQIDPRVVVLDRLNCRYLQAETLGEPVDLVVADLSFISVKTVFPAMQRILKNTGWGLLLIKPQFEIGKGRVGKKGIVRREEDHCDVLLSCREFFIQNDWRVKGIVPSPILGKSGNREFIFYVIPVLGDSIPVETVVSVVAEAHSTMNQTYANAIHIETEKNSDCL